MKRVKAILWIILMAILMVAAYKTVSFRLQGKMAYQKNGDLLRVADDCDVLFLGTSHVTTEVFPMELWKEYGITSYNISGYGHPMALSYWMLMNTLDYADPKVVVVDCYVMESDAIVIRDEKFMHFSLDSIPLSKTKVMAVCDLFDDFDSRAEYLWNFSLYHDRWDELKRDDFEVEYGKTRGAVFEVGLEKPDDFVIRDVEAEPIDSVGVTYLRKIVEACQSRDIEVVLTFLPFPAQEDQQKVAAYAGEIAREYDVDYLNFLQMDVVDYQTDCFDSYSHLNVAGGQKITSFLGRYLQENYGLADHRQDGLDEWDADYAAYQRYKIDKIQSQESLQNYLVMMADKSFSICLYVDGESKIWEYEQYVNQIRNLVPEYTFPALDKVMRQGTDYCLIIDNVWETVEEYYGQEGGETETSFGKVSYMGKEDGSKALCLVDSEESFLKEYCDDGRIPTVQIVLINNLDGTVVDVQRFDESLTVNK